MRDIFRDRAGEPDTRCDSASIDSRRKRGRDISTFALRHDHPGCNEASSRSKIRYPNWFPAAIGAGMRGLNTP